MAKQIEIILPETTQEGTHSVVARWLKKVGDTVTLHEPVVEISTDKVVVEISAPASGVLAEIVLEENAEVHPGGVLGRISEEASPSNTSISEQEASERAATEPTRAAVETNTKQHELSPAVKKLLREHSLDPATIRGSGRDGRITADDVLQAAANQDASKSSPSFHSSPSSLSVPHSPVRKSIANHMTESLLKTAPHVTAVFDADLTDVLEHSAKQKPLFAEKGVKLTLTSYFVAAACKAITVVPEVNSRWFDDRLEIYKETHLGIATATESGLIVPVIRGAHAMTLFEIAHRLGELTEKARNNTLAREDVSGGTFTITNHGMGGSLIATPIIHQPQSAILGIGKLEKRVKILSTNGHDEIAIRPMCYVTLTIDHRVLDGFRANAFLTAFVEALNSPEW